jgi:membrane-bound metal-dependent hydrolase YbcI (DUF457 family)
MASHKAHHATGFAAGVIAAALVAHADSGGPYHVLTVLAFLAAVSGGTAPDWMELAWWNPRKRLWIRHRTLTHWGVGWLGLLAWSYLLLGTATWAPVAFGFAAGGVMHLLSDWPNPLGVPWIYGRHSLKLWKSGRCDLIIVAASWLAAFGIADHVFWNDVHSIAALDYLRSMPICS